MISDYVRLAFRNLRKRKLRAWLTMIGIIIAVATIFVLISMSVGLRGAVEEQFRVLGTDKFFIQPKGQLGGPGTSSGAQLTITDINTIEKVQGVKGVSYGAAGNGELKFAGQTKFYTIFGLALDKQEVFREVSSYVPEDGRLLEKSDKRAVVLGTLFKTGNLFRKPVKVGDTIVINGVDFKVKGILKEIGNPGDDRTVMISLTDLKEISDIGENIDQIMVQTNPGEDLKAVADRTERRLISARGLTKKTVDFTILTPEELLASFGQILNILTAFLTGVAGISLLVGGIGIANTMYTSVIERTREIGVMKAVGAQNKDILTLFLIESGMLGLAGGIIGVLLGIVIAKGIEYIVVNQLQTNLLKAAIPIWLVFACLLFAFLSGAVFGVWPAWRASKIRPVEALRYE